MKTFRYLGVITSKLNEGSKEIKARIEIKLNLWLKAPKGPTSVNKTSAADWQMTVRRDNVITITLRQVC